LRNTRWLQWIILNVGDPLYTPFPNAVPPFDRSLAIDSLLLNPGEIAGDSSPVSPTLMPAEPALADPLLAGLQLLQSSVQGGNSVSATVFLNANAPDGGVTVPLLSDSPGIAAVPATVLVPGGVAQAHFVITTIPIAFSTNVSISTTLSGVQATTTLTIVP
jgi:hypothetical protein